MECGHIIGTGKGKWADTRLAPEVWLEEIDAKQAKFEEGTSQPERSGNQKHPTSQAHVGSLHLFRFPLVHYIHQLVLSF